MGTQGAQGYLCQPVDDLQGEEAGKGERSETGGDQGQDGDDGGKGCQVERRKLSFVLDYDHS